MMVGLEQILNAAREGGYAVPAFNVYNMETVMGVIAAARREAAPVILQGYSRVFRGENGYYLSSLVRAAAEREAVPVCFHLDHGAGELEVVRALRYGCTGVMIDASALPIDQNIALTRRVKALCDAAGVAVEGELGQIGSASGGASGGASDGAEEITSSAQAAEYADATGVCALAVQVGTAHGRYQKPPELHIDRIAEIAGAVPAHLVLHGGSGIPDSQIRAAVRAGIRKINFGTDLCFAFLDKVFQTSRDKIAVDLFMKDAIENVAEFAAEKIRLLGASGQYV